MAEKTYTWDAKDYARHSAGQFKWAQELMNKLHLQGNETVLDIGCGDGKVTAEIAHQVPQGKVVGIDQSENMVNLARQQYEGNAGALPDRAPMTFFQMDATALTFEEQFDVAFSNATLHWVKNHALVLAGVARSLKENGRFLFQMGGRGNAEGINQAMDAVRARKQWRDHFTHFVFPYTLHGPEEYRPMLEAAGLTPIRIELIPKDMQHQGREGLAGWVRTTWLPYTGCVPEEHREQFINEVLDEYLAAHPIDAQGIAHVHMVRLEVEGKRA